MKEKCKLFLFVEAVIRKTEAEKLQYETSSSVLWMGQL
jgi:hypothetical protein